MKCKKNLKTVRFFRNLAASSNDHVPRVGNAASRQVGL